MPIRCERFMASGSGAVSRGKGFTLIELMIVLVIVAIGIALAVPTFQSFRDKRRLTSAAEQVSAFLVHAQSEAIKRNKQVTVSWETPGGHSVDWCIGAVLDDDPCDCTGDDADSPCEIDEVTYLFEQEDFVDLNYELMHMRVNTGNFSFDPIRGTVVDVSNSVIADGDWLFYVHSDEGSWTSREYELEILLNPTGRVKICTDTVRERIIGGYPEC